MSMGRRYAFVGSGLSVVTAKTRMMLVGTTTIRPRTYFLMLSASNATPADSVNEYTFKRGTAITSNANTTVTPVALDPGDPATSVIVTSNTTGINSTVEPATYTSASELLSFSHNMHAVFAWYAPDGGELVQPATANAFFGLFHVAGTTAYNDDGVWHYSE